MSLETSKASNFFTRQKLYGKYLHGRVLDVGCGKDKLVVEGVQVDGFDLEQGDAQHLNAAGGNYDALYSSHCLEHMADVPLALLRWSAVVRSWGHLIIVVPDFLMYEHCQWPSRFNSDHKASFSVFDLHEDVKHSTFYSTGQMIEMGRSAGLELVDLLVECHDYDWHLLNYLLDQTAGKACANVVYVFRKL